MGSLAMKPNQVFIFIFLTAFPIFRCTGQELLRLLHDFGHENGVVLDADRVSSFAVYRLRSFGIVQVLVTYSVFDSPIFAVKLSVISQSSSAILKSSYEANRRG